MSCRNRGAATSTSTRGLWGGRRALLYPSAHNGDPCVALYERARGGLELPAGRDAPLTDPVVLTEIRRIALAHGLLALPR